MITQRKMRLMVCFVLAGTCIGAPNTEPNEPAPKLQFDVGTDSKPHSVKTWSITPTHAATFRLYWNFAEPNDPNIADLLKTSAGKSVSEIQREMIKTEEVISSKSSPLTIFVSKLGGRITHGSKNYWIYAVSEADARNTVRALVEYLSEKGAAEAISMKQIHNEKLTEKKEQLQAKLIEENEEYESVNNELPRARQKYNEAVDNSSYSLHPRGDVDEEVRKTIFEMGKMLDVLNIEIVGIQSKLSAINKHSTQKDVLANQTLLLALKEMAILQEIELVGAESRRQAIMSVKRREETLYHQYESFHNLHNRSTTLKASIGRKQRDIADVTKELTYRLYPGKWPFEINDKIKIRPISAR